MSSQQRLLNASFNQDNSCFSICTRDGYKIFNCEGGNECYQKDDGAINIVEMLYSTSLLAIVGAGEQPALSPRRLCLFNTETGSFLKKLNFVTAILAIRLNRKRLVVVLEESTYIYDLSNLSILDSIDTVPNPKVCRNYVHRYTGTLIFRNSTQRNASDTQETAQIVVPDTYMHERAFDSDESIPPGLCAFSPKEDTCYLALPASTDKGVVLIYNVNKLHSHCQINAHKSPLAAMALSSDGSYIATASEQGTVIRVYLVSQPSEKFTFRRGTYPAAIYSLSLGPPSHLPRLLVATSSSGSVHVFTLGLMTADRNKRSTGLLATVIPTSLNDALEPSYHHVVLHNVLPAGVKSRAIICNVEEVSMVQVMGLTTNTLRVRILSITYNGYFNDYSVIIDDDNKHPWNLERECNLLASPSEQISANFVK